jgi:hypothetical protein
MVARDARVVELHFLPGRSAYLNCTPAKLIHAFGLARAAQLERRRCGFTLAHDF